MRLAVIVNSNQSLGKLIQQNLPIKIAWELKMLVNKITPELKVYEELRTEKIKQYGEEVTDENSPLKGQFKVKDENLDVFFSELNTLLEKEIEIDIPEIKMSVILEYSEKTDIPISLSAAELLTLDWLIV